MDGILETFVDAEITVLLEAGAAPDSAAIAAVLEAEDIALDRVETTRVQPF